jgi:hypothetical protein
MSFRLSVIIPTCGRWSLERTLQSIQDQTLMDGDEILLVTDGAQPAAEEIFRGAGLPGRCLTTASSGDFGGSQRNRGMEAAAGDYLVFMDDDDVFAGGAFATIRGALQQAPDRPHLFRMRYAANDRILWAHPAVSLGNVSTQMIVFPNRSELLGRWDSRHGHDHRFIAESVARWPAGALVWRQEVIAVVRPHERDAQRQHFLPRPEERPARVAECPFREPVDSPEPGKEARCRLLRRLSGVEQPGLDMVGRDACEACCGSFRPTMTELNPVVAALLHGLTDQVLACGGLPGCPVGKAADLQQWAERNLAETFAAEDLTSTPRRVSQPCHYLGPEVGFRVREGLAGTPRLPVFACRHPAHGETTVDECACCRDWVEQAGSPSPPPLEQLVPPPATRQGPAVRCWAVGVTTAPRRQPTLEWCLDSLIRAGWSQPRLFMDPAVPLAERFAHLPVTRREGRLGAWPNYYLALAELLLRDPGADAYLLVQDDAVFEDRHDLRGYLERSLWPADLVGAVSLFCSRAYAQPNAGWHAHPGKWVWGAQAFVFPRASAKRFVADAEVLEHRWTGRHDGLALIDVVIGAWAERSGIPIYYPSPSLVQHVGDTSTLWLEARITGNRKAAQFTGDAD